MSSEPQVQPRPKLAQWMFERGLKPADAEREIGVGRERLRRMCLPFGDPNRIKHVKEDVLTRIIEWTRGEVTAVDFIAPELRPAAQQQPDAGARA